jgi:LacI family transcriptional regulator
MATMKEIAQLAGVSRGTVDRVLNHRGIVNEDTEKKVLEIARLLNYQPNKAGMALAAQKKKLKIGVLLFGADNPFFDEVIDGLTAKLAELSIYGCSTLERRIPFDLETQLATIDELAAEEIHGLILSPYNDPKVQEKIDALWEKNIPCVTVNTDLPSSRRIAYVGSDDAKCGRTAAGLLKLLTQGQGTVGIITGSLNVLSHQERVQAFAAHLAKTAAGIRIADVVECYDDDYKSYEAVNALLAAHPEITALYFAAAGVYGGCKAVLNASLPVPLTIISFDAVPSTRDMLQQGIISATICQQPQEQGARSLSLLVDYLLTGKLPEQSLIHMDLNIKIKESL